MAAESGERKPLRIVSLKIIEFKRIESSVIGKKIHSATDEGSVEAFSFFDRYDRGYIMANDLRLAAADHGLELDAEQGQQLLWRILKPSISSMRDNQPDGATFVQFEKWLWLPPKTK